MTEQEAGLQRNRIVAFNKLDELRQKTYAALKIVTEPWKDGPSGQGPFTGNTRESRKVHSMQINFTATRGTSPAVELKIYDLDIEASELGQFIEAQLRTRLKDIDEAITKI